MGRATREDAAWWATAPKDRRRDPLAVRIRGRWYVLSKMTAEQVRTYHRYAVNALREQLRTSRRRMYGNANVSSSRHIGYNHYRVTDKEARALARAAGKKLPEHGYMLSVRLSDGRIGRLNRTPYGVGHTLGSGYAKAKDVPKRRWVWAVHVR